MEKEKYVERLRPRDISWLAFNERVLQEAGNADVPLFERLKFIAIFSSNLDEFFSVRVSALRQFKQIRKADRRAYNIKPNRILKQIFETVGASQEEFGRIVVNELLPALREEGIDLLREDKYTDEFKQLAIEYFRNHVESHVQAHWVEEHDTTPFLEHNRLYLFFKLKNGRIGWVRVPVRSCGRFHLLQERDGMKYYAFLEDIMHFAIIDRYEDLDEIIECKLSRDAETYIEDEFSGDLIEKIKKAIDERGQGIPTRLLFDNRISPEFLQRLKEIFKLGKSDLIAGGRYHNHSDFFGFPEPAEEGSLFYPAMHPLPHPRLRSVSSIIDHIQGEDELLSFPYQSFEYVPRLLHEAATSPEVERINITLYRISKTSEVAKALIFALEQGKLVTVFIEAKARFDEANNIAWGRQLEERGARVIYSYPGIKIHSKIFLIRMKPDSELKDVGYIGTGNFNEKTSRIYCDHGLLTSKKKFTRDLKHVFNVLAGDLIIPKPKALLISPYTTRSSFIALIDKEILEANAGRPAWMHIKMNSLEDPIMIEKLYSASQAGVKIRMVIRGFCCLVPGVPGMSENIHVTSIIDRYLEHARIYHFCHGGDDQLYMGSADWMTRNLDRRIEVLTPITNKRLKQQLIHILSIQMNDNVKARIIDQYESNDYVQREVGQPSVRAQFDTYEYFKSLLVEDETVE